VLNRNHLLAFLVSFALLALELAWTRIFSAEFFYTFAFLVLSLAVLGLGLGALSLRLVPPLARLPQPGPLLIVAALFGLAGPPLVFKLGLDFGTVFHDPKSAGMLLLAVVLLNAPFFWGGAALALIFRREHRQIRSLYMADLVGAGLGVAGAILLMNAVGTPAATIWLVAPLVAAAAVAGRIPCRVVAVLLLAGMVYLSGQAPGLLHREREERAPISYQHWDAHAKLKIFDFSPEYRGLNIDNVANSPLLAFDGNWDKPDSLKMQFGIDVGTLIDRFDDCTFLSLGAGGGGDVAQALQYGCNEVHAVEVVPHINNLMREGEIAEFTGHIYNDPRVIVATEDARAYVRRFENKFDVIYSLSSNTWAALASGSFALAENYLFTTEAFGDYWRALSDDGFLSMEHQFYMPRMTTEIVDALEREGVERPTEHFAIYKLPSRRRQLVLLSKQPLTDEVRRNAYGELTPEVAEHLHLQYPAREGDEENLINRIVRDGWQAWQDSSAIDLSPATDNRPFVAQLGLWKNFDLSNLERISPFEFRGFPLAKVLILVILLIVVILIVPLNLAPLLGRGERLRAAPWLYFFCIGAGYMMVEVILIQKYTLFIGPPLPALVTVLMTLLLASGIGSQVAGRFQGRVIFGAIVLLLLAEIFVRPLVAGTLEQLPLNGRVVAAAIMLAPLGFFMGMPFPTAVGRVGELVDWGFAIGGAASVLGSTLIVLLAFNFGFTVALLVGAVVYAAAGGLLLRKDAW